MINVGEESGYIEQSLCQIRERLVIIEDDLRRKYSCLHDASTSIYQEVYW
jgi:hypothetical protein